MVGFYAQVRLLLLLLCFIFQDSLYFLVSCILVHVDLGIIFWDHIFPQHILYIVLVSCGCHDKFPQSWWLKITLILSQIWRLASWTPSGLHSIWEPLPSFTSFIQEYAMNFFSFTYVSIFIMSFFSKPIKSQFSKYNLKGSHFCYCCIFLRKECLKESVWFCNLNDWLK